MQRIVFRYRRDALASTLSHNDLRTMFLNAAQLAGLPIDEERRPITMGPPLPPGATSEAEFAVIELVDPRDPSEVGQQLNLHLAPGIHIERAWIALPGNPHENPVAYDEAVYDVLWQNVPICDEVFGRLRQFLAATEVDFTRVREKKVQHLNARALVHSITLLGCRDGQARFRMVLSIGPQGSLRPEEVLLVLGFNPQPDTVHTHRIALLRSSWRHLSPGKIGAFEQRRYL
ncbi:MAG TPA: TIGR03936 family radical SAM-associated protein [Armatimonadota bacterium]|nr:TIGR03936 family radical SAM-associated protein [Armatimonadota bacterium]